ncbi:uncharacterized protein J5M81_009669 isoform 2-T2 [Pluvialis apricaria]
MELDAQEQRIYQLQTKQRERQAELEQKCSRIQQLSQDVEASDQLQEEAQKQVKFGLFHQVEMYFHLLELRAFCYRLCSPQNHLHTEV